ncbi:MAG TPA: ABC transporter substrate-binding protein [Thermoleophilaceae bacterium]|nr:ABC transporter substrate-binding protein [Thermoleophilaceae bacterium]
MTGRLFASVLATILVALAMGCGSDDDDGGGGSAGDGGMAPVRLALSSWPGFGALYIAEEQGYYRDAGLEVDLDLVEDQTNRVQAMQAGEKDGAGMTADTWVRWAAQGVEAKQVLATDESFGGDGIVARDDIAEPSDLRGVRVGVADGSTAEFLLGYVLREAGLTLDDVDKADMSPADAGAAFAGGSVPAAATWQPWLSRAEESPNGHVLADTKDYPVVVTTVGLSSDFIEDNPESVQALVEGTDRAITFLRRSPKEAAAIIARATDQSPEDVTAILGDLRLYGVKENQEFFGTEESPGRIYELWEAAGEIWQQAGDIDSTPSAEDGIDPSFVNAQ